jgi:predicted DNA-binding transcriptional regulator AlpA
MNAHTNIAVKTETHRSNTIILTTPQAAIYLGLAVSTLNKWRCFGDGPRFLKLGRAVRYRREDLDSFLVSRQLGSTAEY